MGVVNKGTQLPAVLAKGIAWWIVAQIGSLGCVWAEVPARGEGPSPLPSSAPSRAGQDLAGTQDAFYNWVWLYLKRKDAAPSHDARQQQ